MVIKYFFVYIAANQRHTVFYTGITNSIGSRIFEHKNKNDKKSFTARYNIDKLLYYETFEEVIPAIMREKQVKKYSRIKKKHLINSINPEWRDLCDDL